MRRVNKQDQEMFEFIRENLDLALISTELNGVETVAIAHVSRDKDGNYYIFPLAILTNDDIFKMMADPGKDLPE